MNPEIDKLASAAIDGEATPEELARYASDPDFAMAKDELAQASEFVSHSELPMAPEGLAQTQIGLAMEQFRADAAQRAVLAAQPSVASKPAAAKESRWALPGWLLPALFSIVVLGGLGITAQNFARSDADEASATTSLDAMTAETTEAMMADDDASDAMEEMDEAMEDAGTDLESPTTMEASDTGPTGAESENDRDFVTPDPINLDGAPFVASKSLRADRVAELASVEPPIDTDFYARCGPENGFIAPDGDLLLVVPFTRGGEPAEVLLYDTGETNGRTAVIVDDLCMVLSQS